MHILASEHWKEYELIDSGGLEKLERFGEFILTRPEPQAVWEKSIPLPEWERLSHATYKRARGIDPAKSDYSDKGEWIRKPGMKDQWFINYSYKEMNLTFRLGLTAFGHIGVFPEQAVNWNYLYDSIKSAVPSSQFPVPSSQSTSSIQHPASSIQHPASSIQYPASSIQHPPSTIHYPASRLPGPQPLRLHGWRFPCSKGSRRGCGSCRFC
jgi:hypothetical protein